MDADTLKAALRALPDDDKEAVSAWLRGGPEPDIAIECRDCMAELPECVRETIAHWLDRRTTPELAPPSAENFADAAGGEAGVASE